MPVKRQSPARTIDELQTQLREISQRACRLEARLDASSMLKRPRTEAWSVAECIAHLNLSNDLFFPVWDLELGRAKRHKRILEDSYRLDFWGGILIWSLEPPPRFRVKAPPHIRPTNVGSREQPFPAFFTRQQQMMEMIERARGLAIDKIKIVSPVDARIRYSIWASFCLAATHERRHLSQAEQTAQAISASSY